VFPKLRSYEYRTRQNMRWLLIFPKTNSWGKLFWQNWISHLVLMIVNKNSIKLYYYKINLKFNTLNKTLHIYS
jgi:hypothetical protein